MLMGNRVFILENTTHLSQKHHCKHQTDRPHSAFTENTSDSQIENFILCFWNDLEALTSKHVSELAKEGF